MADNPQSNNSKNSNDGKSGPVDDQYNHGGMVAFVFSFTFVICFFIYIAFIHPGIDLKENIQVVQTTEGNLAAAAPQVDVSTIKEPWLPNEALVANGKKLFAQNCSMCHGNEGKGDGPAGLALNPRPRNLTEGPWKKGGGFIGWFTVLQQGLPPSSMASYAHLKAVDRWSLVQFINSITKAKVTEDPKKVAEFAKTAK